MFKTFEERAEILDLSDDLKPDMASLTLGSMNFPKQASINDPTMIARLAEKMRAREILPARSLRRRDGRLCEVSDRARCGGRPDLSEPAARVAR